MMKTTLLTFLLLIGLTSIGQDYKSVAQYQGGSEKLKRDIKEKLKIPEAKFITEKKVRVRFTITEGGDVKHIKILNEKLSKKQTKSALKLVESLKTWIPAQDKNGLNIDYRFTLTIDY